MATDKGATNLYRIPHLPAMNYDDIKRFEREGVTPRNPSKSEGGPDGREGSKEESIG